jgi:glycosyltransferase involved in cell wall biosynthesis
MSVTIITPSFNKSRYVLDAIRSVIAQTHQDWTYYIADNSTDGTTRKTIKDFLRSVPDDRIKYLEVNFSDIFRDNIYVPSAVCNALYLLADKKYVFYLSDDDVLHEDCLGSMVKYLDENPDHGACYCRGKSIRVADKQGKEKPENEDFPFGDIYDAAKKPDCRIDGGQVLCRRSVIEQIIAEQELLNLFLMPNIKGAIDHIDGIFLNKLARHTGIFPCPYNSEKALMTHRCTELSTHKR